MQSDADVVTINLGKLELSSVVTTPTTLGSTPTLVGAVNELVKLSRVLTQGASGEHSWKTSPSVDIPIHEKKNKKKIKRGATKSWIVVVKEK